MSRALAPPTDQSWTCINVIYFWPVYQFFTNKVSLDPSSTMTSFSATLDFRHVGFDQKPFKSLSSQIVSNLLETRHRWSSDHDTQMHSTSSSKSKVLGRDRQSNLTVRSPNTKFLSTPLCQPNLIHRLMTSSWGHPKRIQCIQPMYKVKSNFSLHCLRSTM